MADTNLYTDLKKALSDLKTFLDANTAIIKPVIQPLAQLLPQITDLIDGLIGLLGQLKEAINKLDLNLIPGAKDVLPKVTEFTQAAKALLTASETLLPDQAAEIAKVKGFTDLVTGLPAIDQVKKDIIDLIDGVVNDLKQLKPA